jgi:enamine deaminase RidA (YjgF/YER057c/UK114 family)
VNSNGQYDLLDILNILSFVIGILNYNENLTQGDKQEIMQTFDKQAQQILSEIHQHLEQQDMKIDRILKQLEGQK